MENNVINTLLDRETVTSTYADIYFDNDYCSSKLSSNEENVANESIGNALEEWVSPSDLLIGKIEVNPPFTSKITRGRTHEGILAIGNEVLTKEHKRFMASLTGMLRENDESWNHILINEKQLVTKKVKEIFENIFQHKSLIMNEEILKFYEKSLQDLEIHLQLEVQNVLSSVRAKMISTLNIEIPNNLKKKKIILEKVFKQKYKTELDKIVIYYKLLLENELTKHSKLINYALNERNDALKNFCKQIDAERLTASMYIMSIERKKCKIQKLLLEKLQNSQVTEKLTKIRERQDTIHTYKQREQKAADINKQWEDKMKKVLELFLKFISFSLKLLPEQSNFLLDFQKMVVIQFNELQKQPNLQPNILIDEGSLKNIFQFETTVTQTKVCNVEPFVIVGDLSDPIPPRYGSTETLATDVELPYIRVNREYIYAKCHGYEDIKKILNSQKCQCTQQAPPIYSEPLPTPSVNPSKTNSAESTSSIESLLIDDIARLNECPSRKCRNWNEKYLFPFLPSYLDFSEKNFERVKAILGKPCPKDKAPELIRVKDIAYKEIPFAETKEKYRHAETQYSVQEFEMHNVNCTCVNDHKIEKSKSAQEIKDTRSQILTEVLTKRKASLRGMLKQNPNLLKIFTDENYDFQM